MNLTTETILETIKHEELSNSDKLVLLSIKLFSNEEGVVDVKNKVLTDVTGMAQITVSKSLETLENLGIIKRSYHKDKCIPGGFGRRILML